MQSSRLAGPARGSLAAGMLAGVVRVGAARRAWRESAPVFRVIWGGQALCPGPGCVWRDGGFMRGLSCLICTGDRESFRFIVQVPLPAPALLAF